MGFQITSRSAASCTSCCPSPKTPGRLPRQRDRKETLAGGQPPHRREVQASKTWTWYAGAPFPAVNTHTIDTELLSPAGTDNFLTHTTIHTTINAAGVPTVTVDTVRLECAG